MEHVPQTIDIYHARTHNLKDVTLHLPLRRLVAIAGLSGSGKSSLAMGVLYAEGSRRYLEGLSAFTRRKLHQMEQADAEKLIFFHRHWHCGSDRRNWAGAVRWERLRKFIICCA
ncbi:excinuclease ABC subunit A paralog [Sporolactobacillus inulinus]|uniref:UvrABC system protein A n=1 Tax=Sporolactobacillus inulinus TaxID=2078 RepID=A0A4Y1ZCQ0_9BACL|nr:hypothetical protein [Sporolactobacillus inulinus]GAY76711.1 excinuclease ABC subunit A paralog [Sporolactobacillus inulinus]